MRSIPIASERDDARVKERAYGEVAAALAAGEIVGIFPEGQLTHTGEMNAFRPGVQRIVAATPVPVVPMALRGLWGSFFSRSHRGSAMRRMRGIFSRISLVAAPPLRPADATLEALFRQVSALRGDAK
jgi:1-acyl-sn-glycerol-3-phosphate acyltransferase